MGQPVPNVKDNVSRDMVSRYVQTWDMVNNLTKYKEAFCARLRCARIVAGHTQKEMADMLDIPRDTYAKYERRSLLRHDLIAAVAKITGHDTWYILTGQPRREVGIIPEKRKTKDAGQKRGGGNSWSIVRGGRT